MMYKKQNDDFLKFLITERFIKPWTEGDFENYKSLSSVSRLELFITSSCNQKCEYCYLCKYEDSLYPKEIREQETILKNLQIFLNFLLENKVKIYSADLFSGEIWHTDFGLKVLELIYEYLMKGLQIRQFIVASNCSFIESKQHFFKIQKYIKLYREIGSSLDFSISIDGKINEDISRQLKNGQRDEEFYDKLFSFAAYNHFGFHPMISACTIENAKENYLWFKNECKKHDLNFYNAVMFLEVRNNDWTKEKLEHYADFLKFYIDDVSITYPKSLKFRNKVLEDLTTIYPGQVYSADEINKTYSRLSALKVFSSVNVGMTQCDTNKVNCSISLAQSKLQGFKVNLEASVNSSGLFGISPQITYYHKNIFRGGEWLNLGFMGNFQFKFKDAIQKEYKAIVDGMFATLRSSERDRSMNRFRERVSNMKGGNQLRSERERLFNKVRQLEQDIALLENNIGFFSKSKNAETLIADVREKIERSKRDMAEIIEKIKLIDEQEAQHNA